MVQRGFSNPPGLDTSKPHLELRQAPRGHSRIDCAVSNPTRVTVETKRRMTNRPGLLRTGSSGTRLSALKVGKSWANWNNWSP